MLTLSLGSIQCRAALCLCLVMICSSVQAQFVFPRANPDVYTAIADTEAVFDVLANDSGDLSLDSVDIDGTFASAWINPEDEVIHFMPRPGFLGELTFNYNLLSDGGFSLSTTVTVTVEAQAVDDLAVADVGQTVWVDVLSNDLGANRVDWAISSSGLALIEADQRIRVTPTTTGMHTITYGLNTLGGPVGMVTLYVRDSSIPTIQASDRKVVALADGNPVKVLFPQLYANRLWVRDGAHGHAQVSASTELSYLPDHMKLGVDRLRYYLLYASGQWSEAIVEILLMDPNLSHYYDFEKPFDFFDPTVVDQGLQAVDGMRINSSDLILSTPRIVSVAAQGNQSLDLSANDRGLLRVEAPVDRQQGSLSAWIHIPPAGLKFGTGNDHMTLFATSSNGQTTQWAVTLEPSSLQTGAIHVREFFADFHTGQMWFKPDTWYHVAYVYSGLNRVLMINGQVVAETDADNPFRLASHQLDASQFIIGNRFECLSSDCGASFGGLIDEVRLRDERADLLTMTEEYLQTNPNLQFLLGMDDITDPLKVDNAVNPDDVVTLNTIQGAPYKVSTSLPEVGLMYDSGGGHLGWEVQSGHLNPDSSWLAWTIQLPDAGLTEDIVLIKDEDDQLKIALESTAFNQARLVLRDQGNEVLASEVLDFEPSQSLDIQAIWRGNEAYLYIGDQQVAGSSTFGLSYAQLNQVSVSLAAGVSLWMLQYGDGDDAPRQGQQEAIKQLTVGQAVNIMWVPVKPPPLHGLPPLDNRPVAVLFTGGQGSQFRAACTNSIPQEYNATKKTLDNKCKAEMTTTVALEHNQVRPLKENLQQYKIPVDRNVVYWWDRRKSALHDKPTGASFDDILGKRRILVNQFQGTGGSDTTMNNGFIIPGDTFGISDPVWSGFDADGQTGNNNSDDSCGTDPRPGGPIQTNSWSNASSQLAPIVGSAFGNDASWIKTDDDVYSRNCSQKAAIRCTCVSTANKRDVTRIYKTGGE